MSSEINEKIDSAATKFRDDIRIAKSTGSMAPIHVAIPFNEIGQVLLDEKLAEIAEEFGYGITTRPLPSGSGQEVTLISLQTDSV